MTLYDSDLNTCIVAFDDFFGVDDVFNGAIGEAVRRIVSGELVGDKWGLWFGLALENATPEIYITHQCQYTQQRLGVEWYINNQYLELKYNISCEKTDILTTLNSRTFCVQFDFNAHWKQWQCDS